MNLQQLTQKIADQGVGAAPSDSVTTLETALVVTNNSSPNGNDVELTAGDYQDVNGNGGNLTLEAGVKNGTGTAGQILMSGLPSADPHILNALWKNAGVLTVSAG